MATKLAVYNDALLALGQERIASLSEASTARYALDDAYDRVLAYCLEQGFWNWAMRSVELSPSDSIDPSFGFSYAYEKPDDWVRTHSISASDTFDPPLMGWNDENGIWYCNTNPMFVRFVSNDPAFGYDLSLWPETFVNYVALRLAVRTCKRITGSDPSDELQKSEKRAMADSRSKDAMNEPPQYPPTGTWVQSRRGGLAGLPRWGWR